MASHKEKKETLALCKLFEGLEDTIIYTVGPEEDVRIKASPEYSDEAERKVKKAQALKKRLYRED